MTQKKLKKTIPLFNSNTSSVKLETANKVLIPNNNMDLFLIEFKNKNRIKILNNNNPKTPNSIA